MPTNLALEAVFAVLVGHVVGAVDAVEGLQAEVAKVGDAARRWGEAALLERGARSNTGSQR